MIVKVFKNIDEIGKYAANIIINQIKKKSNLVLGLATGSSPIITYKNLVADYKQNKTDWSKVKTFNLDEYIGLDQKHPQSYYQFMQVNLFKDVNIDPKNINIPIGTNNYQKYANNYDKLIKKAGGIDLQILGLGENGHIGFNEPPCDFESKTQVVNLVESTINANSRFFEDINDVPKQAVSMGISSIMKAKEIMLLANGKKKAKAIKELVEGAVSNKVPCTILQKHPQVLIIIDEEAASLLKKKK